MVNLTNRQTLILEFINKFASNHGFPPTVREIGLHFGISSTNGVKNHLEALERKGAIERLPKLSRGIRVVA